MHDMIRTGKAHYWGTSEWERRGDQRRRGRSPSKPPSGQAGDGAAAIQSVSPRARRARIRAPVLATSASGATTWSPLASGLLERQVQRWHSGRFARRAQGLRMACRSASSIRPSSTQVRSLAPIAADLGCTLAQLALAWCLKNPNVSERHHRSRADRRRSSRT